MGRPPGAECHYCGDPATSWDHVVPLGRGGPNGAWNRVPACADCNTAKADLLPACPCDFCVAAANRWLAEGRFIPVPPPPPWRFVETGYGLPVEAEEQLQAWLERQRADEGSSPKT